MPKKGKKATKDDGVDVGDVPVGAAGKHAPSLHKVSLPPTSFCVPKGHACTPLFLYLR
jgi:hypothetical protein